MGKLDSDHPKHKSKIAQADTQAIRPNLELEGELQMRMEARGRRRGLVLV